MIDLGDMTVRRNGTVICSVERLTVAAGQRVAVIGANGTGKTTLLRVLAGLETAVAGRCVVQAPRRRRVYVHQNPFLFRGTALYNVMYGLRAHGVGRESAETTAREWLDRLGIAHFAARRVDTLSGGERRRIALARALALEPELLLLDEPLAELDELGITRVTACMRDLEATTLIIASPTELPDGLTDRTHRLVETAPARDRQSV